jgi:2-C-methyl-D-erythritol 4-phosphate cytidylyltransferase/2-C-methyl-D-erythritol 2,4-cyclodiphosphate synthase
MKWKGAASDQVPETRGRAACTARGGRIANLEVTMICEASEDRPAARCDAREASRRSPGVNVNRALP